MSGRLIVIEGLDGSGKATQTARLAEALTARGMNVRQVSFPDYESDSSAPIKMYLAGDFGREAGDVNAYAASAFYAIDRFASYKTKWGEFYNGGGVVISDRYTTSNAIHQCCKLPRDQWDSYLEWLYDNEYGKMGIPKPDLVIYLKVGVSASQKLMTGRYNGDEDKKDLHEKDLSYQASARVAAAYCAENAGWVTIECEKDGDMRSIDSIHAEIMEACAKVLAD